MLDGFDNECSAAADEPLSTPAAAVPIIAEMQLRAAAIARAEVERTLRRVGVDPDLEARLDAMARSIVDKVLDQPSARLRKAVEEGGEGDAILRAAKQMFQLGTEPATRRSRIA
jgi:glutamyl-tRNA reductase